MSALSREDRNENIHLVNKETFIIRKSCSLENISGPRVQIRRLSLQPGPKTTNFLSQEDSQPDTLPSVKYFVIKTIKEFFSKTSSIMIILNVIAFLVVLTIQLHLYSAAETSHRHSYIKLLSSVLRAYKFVLPAMLVLFDEKVLEFSKKWTTIFIFKCYLKMRI